MPTQKQLKEIYFYNPLTGIFRKIGSESGRPFSGEEIVQKKDGYVSIRFCGRAHQAHRLAWLYMTGNWPKRQIDHINHVKNDNRFINLRDISAQENMRNRSLSSRNLSGIPGVYYSMSDTWFVAIGENSKSVHIGSYSEMFEAICARKSAENKYGYHPNHGKTPKVFSPNKYVHNETREIYMYLLGAPNLTALNSVIIYHHIDRPSKVEVREVKDFDSKFTLIEDQ